MIEVKAVSVPTPAIVRSVARFRLSNDYVDSVFLWALFLLISVRPSAAQAVAPQAGVAAEQTEAPQEPGRQKQGTDLLAYWYGPNYRTVFVFDPNTGKAADIERNSIEYTHTGSWGMLNNFADLTVAQSDKAEPASGGGSGATELYAILRPGISLNALTNTTTFRKGPLRDITVEVGANLETKNSSYAPSEKTLYIGPKLEFALPRGFFNVGLHYRKEWNHEGVLGKSEHYDPDFNIEPAWLLPFKVGKVHLAYAGFADYNTAKGKDSFGSETVGEFLLRNTLALDVGALLFGRAELIDVTGGFWYWHNEYGKPSSDPGAEQMTPLFGLAFHLDRGRAIRRN